MPGVNLTDQEKAAFYEPVTRNRALDYFYVFDNVPLQFVYRDGLNHGDLTQVEKRNKAITETLWLDAYHQYLVANVGYRYFYRGSVLQMVFQVHQFGPGAFAAPEKETRPYVPTAEEVRANFDAFMSTQGWQLVDESRRQPARGSWQSLLGAPDRSVRISSLLPTGNQVVLECISTWTEDGVLKETAWAVVLLYDADGTVLQDRSYIDLVNWPSSRRRTQPRPGAPPPPSPAVSVGVLNKFFDYHRSRLTAGPNSDLEKRNTGIIENEWLKACNEGHSGVFQPERFRLQLPIQKCSCNLENARQVEATIRQAAPDRKMRVALTYAKGNQVAAEGVMTWTENGISREAPFLSIILLDGQGKIIRERRYISLSNWPGADKLASTLGI